MSPASPRLARAMTLGVSVLGLLMAAQSLSWPGKHFPGFLILPNRVVASVGLPTWSGVAEGRPLYQQVVTGVAGADARSSLAVYEAVARHAPGDRVRYQVVRQGTAEEREFPVRIFGWDAYLAIFAAYLLSAVAYLALAAVAAARWRTSPLFPALAGFSWMATIFALTAIDLYGAGRAFRLHALAEAMLPVAAIHLALVCPRSCIKQRPGVLPLLYGSGVALAITYEIFLYEPAAYTAIHNASQALIGVGLIAFTVRLGLALHETASDLDAVARRCCLAGALVGFVVPALVLAISGLSGGLVPVNATAWFSFAFPLACLVALRGGIRHLLPARRALATTASESAGL